MSFTHFTMNRIKMADGTFLHFNAPNSSVFFAIQPHQYQGLISTDVLTKESKKFQSNLTWGDHIFVNDIESVNVSYKKRGGANLDYWQIPSNLCSKRNVISSNQRSASIMFNTTTQDNVCWFLSFRSNVTFHATLRGAGHLTLCDNKTINSGKCVEIDGNSESTGNLGEVLFVSFIKDKETKDPSIIDITVNSSMFYGDWTSSPSIFDELTDSGKQKVEEFEPCISVYKGVATWIFATIIVYVVIIYVVCMFLLVFRPRIEKYQKKKHE